MANPAMTFHRKTKSETKHQFKAEQTKKGNHEKGTTETPCVELEVWGLGKRDFDGIDMGHSFSVGRMFTLGLRLVL